MNKENSLALSLQETDITPLFKRSLGGVREDLRNDPYISEALRVLPVGGYRSAIGSFWNAVVDDLRNKVIHRSLLLFNKEVSIGREIKSYEDFQQYVNDDQLIEGAYKIGVIGYEASRILKHAKETRHFFDGHPKSSDPSIVKVLSMMDDCIKYVLNDPFPPQIIDIDDYIKTLDSSDFDRNEVAIEIALTELPETYKNQLANRLYTSYVHPQSSSVLRSNVEFVLPILWSVLPKPVQLQIARRVDQEIAGGNSGKTEKAFGLVSHVKASSYLSPNARRYKVEPQVTRLKENLDKWDVEAECVKELLPYASVIPEGCLSDYVWTLTHTYVGYVGGSAMYARTNFYSNAAAPFIPKMFEKFDDAAAEAFIETIRDSRLLRSRIQSPSKLRRLRSLANIVQSRVSTNFTERDFLDILCDEDQEEAFNKLLKGGLMCPKFGGHEILNTYVMCLVV